MESVILRDGHDSFVFTDRSVVLFLECSYLLRGSLNPSRPDRGAAGTFADCPHHLRPLLITVLTNGSTLGYASPNIQQNKTVGIRGVIIDITERKQAEEANRNAEAHYHALFDQSPNGILLIDTETGRTIEVNETAYKQLGYTREEFAVLRISD